MKEPNVIWNIISNANESQAITQPWEQVKDRRHDIHYEQKGELFSILKFHDSTRIFLFPFVGHKSTVLVRFHHSGSKDRVLHSSESNCRVSETKKGQDVNEIEINLKAKYERRYPLYWQNLPPPESICSPLV